MTDRLYRGLRARTSHVYSDTVGPEWPRIWLLVTIGCVLYGSLLPFDLQWRLIGYPHPSGLRAFSLDAAAIDDIATNLLVYFPIGLAAMFCGTRPRRDVSRLIVAVTIGTLVSLGAEGLQTRAGMRVASWTDVAVNALGTTLGALAGLTLRPVVPVVKSRLRRAFRARPYASLASLLAITVIVLELAPFDFVTSTDAMHEAFGRARWDFVAPRLISAGEPPLSALVGQFSGAACFAALAYLLGLCQRETGCNEITSLLYALKHGVILAVLIELLQLFTVSHAFDLATVMLRGLGVTLGAWSASFLYSDQTEQTMKSGRRVTVPTLVLVWAALTQLAVFLTYYVDPNAFTLTRIEFQGTSWLPFEAAWHRTFAHAATYLGSKYAAYAGLALTVGIILRRLGTPLPKATTTALTVGCATVVEIIGLASGHHLADITNPLLALLAAKTALRAIDWTEASAGNDSAAVTVPLR